MVRLPDWSSERRGVDSFCQYCTNVDQLCNQWFGKYKKSEIFLRCYSGEPGFGLEPWSKENPWFVSIKETISIESDYAMTYNIAKEEARTTPSPNSDSCESSPAGATTANPHPGIFCADGWDLYTYSFEGEDHHSCFWFGHPNEMVF